MSLWSMNDGSALSHNITTNGSATVTSAGTSFITDGIRSGDLIVTAGGEVLRVKTVDANNSLTLAVAATGSESGVAGTLRKPPTNGSGITTAGTTTTVVNDTSVFGITSAESLGGLDNITSVNVGDTTLGTLTTIGGNTYNGSAPTVTIAGPTARTIAQAAIAEDATGLFTVAGHGMRTGTKLTYGRDGSGTLLALGGSNVADGTAVFVVRVSDDTFGLNTNETNALAGTKLAVTNDGHNTQTFTGVTATATAAISGGKVTGYTITNVGSDYQSAPAVTIAAPTGSGNLDLTNAGVLVVADDEIAIPSAMYAVISTGEAVTYTQGSSGAQADLTTGTVYYLIKSGTANRISLATTYANAVAGTKITLTAVASGGTAHTLIGGTATATSNLGLGNDDSDSGREIAHVGWVKRTVGTGGRAGRVQYETLVAASSISGDFEDIATPDS